MPRIVVVEEYHEFDARHSVGGKPVSTKTQQGLSLIIWPDAAFCSQSDCDMRYDPSPDPIDRAKVLEDYWSQRVKDAVERYKKTQTAFLQRIEFALKYADQPGPPDNARQILDDLDAEVLKCQESLAAVKATLDTHERTQPSLTEITLQLDRERRARVVAVQGELLNR